MTNEIVKLDESINNLKRITHELAEEVKYDEIGPSIRFVKLILDNINSMAGILDKDCNIICMNKRAMDYCKKVGYEVSNNGECPMLLDKEYCKLCPVKKTIKTRLVETAEYDSPVSGKKIKYTCIPLIFNGVSGVISIVNGKL